jgi:Mn-containing catalase
MLQNAVELEFATVPPYLAAMWSIRDGDEPVTGLLQQIVHQEMLHMGLVANVLNAIGGTVNISGRIPAYATTSVNLHRGSK